MKKTQIQNTKPFYKSKTIVTAVLSLIASFTTYLVSQAGVPELSPFISENMVEVLVAINTVTNGFSTWFRSIADTSVTLK